MLTMPNCQSCNPVAPGKVLGVHYIQSVTVQDCYSL
jgi:hypothetical protein